MMTSFFGITVANLYLETIELRASCLILYMEETEGRKWAYRKYKLCSYNCHVTVYLIGGRTVDFTIFARRWRVHLWPIAHLKFNSVLTELIFGRAVCYSILNIKDFLTSFTIRYWGFGAQFFTLSNNRYVRCCSNSPHPNHQVRCHYVCTKQGTVANRETFKTDRKLRDHRCYRSGCCCSRGSSFGRYTVSGLFRETNDEGESQLNEYGFPVEHLFSVFLSACAGCPFFIIHWNVG